MRWTKELHSIPSMARNNRAGLSHRFVVRLRDILVTYFTSQNILLRLHSNARSSYAGFLDGEEPSHPPENEGLCPMMRVLEGAAVVINHSAKYNTSYTSSPGASAQASGSATTSGGSPSDRGSTGSSRSDSSPPPVSDMETLTPIPEQAWTANALLATESLFSSQNEPIIDPATVGLSVEVPLIQHGLEIIPPVYPFMSTSEAIHGGHNGTNGVDVNLVNGVHGVNELNGSYSAFDASSSANALPQFNNDQAVNFTAMLSDLLPDSLQTFYNSALASQSKDTPTDVYMFDGATQVDDAAWQKFFSGLEQQNVQV